MAVHKRRKKERPWFAVLFAAPVIQVAAAGVNRGMEIELGPQPPAPPKPGAVRPAPRRSANAVGRRVSGSSARSIDNAADAAACLAAIAESRDRQAFATLFRHFAPRLKSYVCKLGTDPMTAEELVQETMVTLWRKAAHYDPAKAAPSTWIFTIARNLRIDAIRRERRPEPDMADPLLVPEPAALASETIEQSQRAARLRRAVLELPKDQRAVLQLSFFEDHAHGAIADHLGIPLGTVKSRLRLAFRRLRSVLGDQ